MPAQPMQKCVVAHGNVGALHHELETNRALARWLAEILGWPFADTGCNDSNPMPALYFVPTQTLVGEELDELGISGVDDLLGGYVQHAFIATKAISHPLIADARARPEGWNPQFGERVRDVVLAGVTVFDHNDARRAATEGLRRGALRVKQVEACGGTGQAVLRTAQDLMQWLDDLDAAVCAKGIVLEENLEQAITHSVGQTLIDGLLMTYHGRQSQTRNTRGECVYAGSDLLLVRGDYIELLARELTPDVRRAIEYARTYDTAAALSFPGFFASRRNYDVVQGLAGDGQPTVGVLEQSWRVGGATGAELAALQAFRERPRMSAVRASTHEIHTEQTLPQEARVLYRGHDRHGDCLLKYARIDAYDS
ncbi:DUF3182 family protein [Pseudomonas gingeri]|uniref:DUF3182 family protein n=1 Tax=Pseudomonas gingeri TaxID=117681 RepID=A0A7Y7YCL9_9PSED|nr:DUF3182 family protein [Pseudomonas gingeri]NWB28920.1 DUF3182 family protein [Pseudomonas gingeri]NWC34014.1 DUF3182 family protein [Pseudomonas gingeri]NWD50031.1 DUF3182 family protein [Pseudomonas gingeri]NWE28077.1 DUF3182 family protein [Pseudomonas gingeri]NWE94026.1 DUF3182 family protein [Pseudomonas gingeri]